jgi:hypothetical protein
MLAVSAFLRSPDDKHYSKYIKPGVLCEMSVVVIETVEDGSTEWGISLTDSNPKEEDYFKMSDKETAFRLKERLTVNSPISLNEPLGRPTNKLAGVE